MADAVKEYGYNWWISKLDEAEKRLKDEWWKTADDIVKKFKAKKGADAQDTGRTYLLNIFWANVGVMKAALYARPPKPMVERVWADQNDNIGRVAALMLQRCLAFDFLKNNSPMSEAFKLAVEDRLIPGLGCLWMRYEMEEETVSVPGIPGGDPVKFQVISEEECKSDYVHWRDVVFPSGRVWDEIWYIARKIYMTPSEFKAKFKKKVDKDADTSVTDSDKILPTNFAKGKVTVYEIWCKRSNKVYWVSREVNGFCQEKDDFLELDDFYPCPKFLLSTHTTDDFLPRPDYTMVKDQYEQLNELNTRTTILEKALRVVGVYDKKNAEVGRILTDARENEMIPCEKWAVLGEQGGLKGVVDWFPLEQIAIVLEKLTVQKAEKIKEIYELTGISDIMRGSTNPRETLGAQQLKSQYSSVRLQLTQGDVSCFVREALVIKAQIICKHFQDETILKLSNIEQTPDAQFAPQALQLLRDSEITEYRIDINEEGLALPDYNQEKQTRIEFLTTVGQFLSQAAPITAAMPGAMPYLVQIVKWVAAGMRGSNEIQGVLDSAILALNQSPPQQQQQPQDHSVEVEQIKQQGKAGELRMKGQIDKGLDQNRADLELRNAMQLKKMEGAVDAQTTHTEVQGDLVKTQMQGKQEERQMAMAAQLDAHLKSIDATNEERKIVRDAMMGIAQQNHQFAHERDMAERDHQHALAQQDNEPKPVVSK